jgi:hypothetical protein
LSNPENIFFIAMSGQENKLARSGKTRKSRVFYRPRFSLKTLLVFVAMCAAIFAAFPHVRAWWAQEVSLDRGFKVREVNGGQTVTYKGAGSPKNSHELAWLTNVRVFRMNHHLDGSDLRYIANWTHLRSLNIGGKRNSIRDEDLKHLQDLTTLESLYLGGADIVGPGLQHLGRLQNLEHLYLRSTKVEIAEDLQHIASLGNLKSLILADTNVTSESIRPLSNLSRLQYIDLSRTNVDDSLVDSLLKMSALQRCRLLHTKLSAKGIRRLEAAGIDTLQDLPGPIP